MSSKKRINRDRAKKKNRPQVENEAIANYLEDLLIPAMAAQKTFYRQLNLRDRILTLPINDSLRIKFIMARRSRSNRINQIIKQYFGQFLSSESTIG